MDPRDHVNRVRQSVSANDPVILGTLGRALDRLQKALPRRGHFILEFLQNASDAGATLMEGEITREGVIIRNSGRPCSAADVTSICNVGLSTKAENPGNYIGGNGVQVIVFGVRLPPDRLWRLSGHF